MNKTDKMALLMREMLKTYRDKNADYGDSFAKSYEEFGLTAPIIRISDKLERLKSLSKAEAKVKDESIRDTLIDLANYAIMTVVELEEETFVPDDEVLRRIEEYEAGFPKPFKPAGFYSCTGKWQPMKTLINDYTEGRKLNI